MAIREVLHAEIYTPDGYSCYYSVADEQAAVQECLSRKGYCFKTVSFNCDVEDTADGQKTRFISGPVGAESGVRYVGIEKLYTLKEAAEALNNAAIDNVHDAWEQKRFKLLSDTFNQLAAAVDRIANKAPVGVVIRNPFFKTLLPSADSFIFLKDGEKVFDDRGQQIWPGQIAKSASPSKPQP